MCAGWTWARTTTSSSPFRWPSCSRGWRRCCAAPVPGHTADGWLHCGALALDPAATKAYREGREIALTAQEYRLFAVLMENKNQTLTRARLLEKLWDADGNFVSDNTLTVTMKRLREKLGRPSYIQTLRGIGYRLEEPV